jgi:hypothetical protein
MIPIVEVESVLISSTGNYLLVNTSSGALAVRLVDGLGLGITSTNIGSKQALDVNIATSSGNVNVHDGLGNPISSTLSPEGDRYLNAGILQHIIISTGNSSTTNIAGNSYFTGIGESSIGVAAIQVTVISSNNGVLYIQQSTDGVYWDVENSYLVTANFAYSQITKATASYFRILFYNRNNSATLFFRLQTILGPILEPLPRSLTQEGNLRVAIAEHFPTKMEGNSEKISMTDMSVRRLLNDILCELQQMNIHMNQITDLNLNEYDSDKF